MSFVLVRQANLNDLLALSDILDEAASWLKQQNMALWEKKEVSPKAICQDVEAGLFYMAFVGDSPAGVVKFQLEDLMFWSDISQEDSAFIHRLAVRRCFAGGNVATELTKWAVKAFRVAAWAAPGRICPGLDERRWNIYRYG